MKPLEIVEKIKAENPEAFGKVSDKVAAKIIKLGITEIAKQLSAIDEGDLRVVGLGNFKVSNATREKDGVQVSIKKVSLRIKSVDEKEEA